MIAKLLHQAAAKFEELVTGRNLTQYFEVEEFSSTQGLSLVVGAGCNLHIWDYGQWSQPRSVVSLQEGRTPDLIYSLAVVKTNEGPRIVAGTHSGNLCLVDPCGYVIWQTRAAAGSIWHVTTGPIAGQILLFVCAKDQTMKVYDLRGQLRCTMRTPGRMLSVDVREINGRILLAGGTQERNCIYLWDLEEILTKQTGTPSYLLTGGQRPAFCTKLVELAGEPYVAHGSWDGNCYLYRIGTLQWRGANKPEIMLQGNGAVYPVVATEIQGTPLVLAGTDGFVLGWELLSGRWSPAQTVAFLEVRARAISAVKICGQIKLFVGSTLGVGVLDLDRLEDKTYARGAWLQTGGGDVTGIAIVQDPR